MRIVPTPLLRLVATGPAVVASLVLEVTAISLLPDPAGGWAMLGFAVGVGVLACGFLESWVVRLVTWSRPASLEELEVWAPVQAHLSRCGVENRRLLIRRLPTHMTRGAVRLGAESFVITPGVLDAIYLRRLAVTEVAAVCAHAEGWHGFLARRGDLATVVVTIPWRVLAGALRGKSGGMSKLRLGGGAWKVRGVMGVICVVEGAVEGPLWGGVLGGLVIALSYLSPAAARELSRRATLRADELVVSIGLGSVLAALWRRLGEPVAIVQRQRLEASASPAAEAPKRGLFLVPG
ncbi:hypothetical protein GCM10023339_41510 [Alloalcanivorax gelatiniphagus]